MDVNYRKKRWYNTARYPIRQPRWVMGLIRLLSKLALAGKNYRIEKINMEGLKPPYMLLSNHMAFMDFELIALATWPHRSNSVASLDGYYRRARLMELIGCIATRKFIADLHLVKSIRRVIQRGDILCLYPEARYSAVGITAFLPESLGKLVKMNKCPLVVAVHHGNHLAIPYWNGKKPRRGVPLHLTVTQLLTAEQVQQMSAGEINAALCEALDYDEYRYQKEKGFLITEPDRAEGLNRILYHCPHCLTESRMASRGTELFCQACGKHWNLEEDGSLRALEGETEFDRIPDWWNWERAQVRARIDRGEYRFEDEVQVYSIPGCRRYYDLGRATVRHTPEEGFVLEGVYRDRPYCIRRPAAGMNSLYVEFACRRFGGRDGFVINTETDSFYCFPDKPDVVTMLNFAAEELYKKTQQLRRPGDVDRKTVG